jgi:hypothetical protein
MWSKLMLDIFDDFLNLSNFVVYLCLIELIVGCVDTFSAL